MPAPISVVIPTLNAAKTLPNALAALVEGVEAELIRDLVISDAGSTDATVAIGESAGARVVTGKTGRGGQIARGVAACDGQWVLILHADSWLGAGWSGAVRSHLEGTIDRAGYFRLAFRSRGWMPRVVAGWANARSRFLGLPYGDQGFLVLRQALEHAGGVPDIPLMEDVALARAFRRRLAMLPATVTTSAERYEREGWLVRGGRNLWLLGRYMTGADPADLALRYNRSPAAIDRRDRSG